MLTTIKNGKHVRKNSVVHRCYRKKLAPQNSILPSFPVQVQRITVSTQVSYDNVTTLYDKRIIARVGEGGAHY